MDNSYDFWVRSKYCDQMDPTIFEILCDTYGDIALTNEDYDGTEVGYQISYNCERYRQDIGGAQTFAATMFVALAALLILN